MLRNTLAGIENYDATKKRFTYKGYGVVFDGYYYHLTEPTGHTSTNQFNSWQNAPVAPEVAIDRAKHRIWELIRQVERSKAWHHKNEVESKLEKARTAYSPYWGDGDDYTVSTYLYRGVVIKVKQDIHQQDCPWDDWDGEPSALIRSTYGESWSTAYGKNKITIGSEYHYGQIDIELLQRYIGLFLRGISKEFYTSGERYVAFWTGEEIDYHFGGDYHMADAALDGAIETFKEWAEGQVFGYVIEFPEDADDEDFAVMGSCWGFYGDDGYMLSEAMSEVDYVVDRMEEAKREADEEVASMIESELGFRPQEVMA